MDRLQLYFIPVLVSTRLEPAQARVSCVKIILTENHWSLAAAWAGLGCCVLVAVAAVLSAPRPITNQHDLDTSDLVIGANIRNHRKLVIDGKKQNTTNILSHNNIWVFTRYKDIWFWYQVISNTWGHKETRRCCLPIAILTMPPVLLGVRVLHETLVRTLAPFCLSTTWQLKKCRKGSNYSGHTRKKFLLSIEECDLFK